MKKQFALLLLAGALSGQTFAQNQTSCPFRVLSGTLTTNRTLDPDSLYCIRGCYEVTNNATLTILAGTTLIGEKSSDASLYVAPGSRLDVLGTSTNPVTFTSDQAQTFRARGDWNGIIIGGHATNNAFNGYIPIDRTCQATAGANNNDADNSGTLQYLQIHYAKSGLTLASVGYGTTIDHIQVTNASRKSFEILGGAVNMQNLVSVDPRQDDFEVNYGYHGNLYKLLGWRADAAANDASGSHGMYILNDPAGSTNTPVTRPVISNLTLIGPKFCNTGSISANFLDGIEVALRGHAAIYNSVVTGWGEYGLNLSNPGSIQATASNDVQFSYNSFHNNGMGDYTSGTWTTACQSTMALWLDGGTFPCAEAGNQFASPAYTVGYNSSICSSSTPDFRLGTNGLDAPDYTESDLSHAFFSNTPATRGAFDGSTNWVATWSEFDPQNVSYCPPPRPYQRESIRHADVLFAPNPSNGLTQVLFESKSTGRAMVSVLDNVGGQVLRSVKVDVSSTGAQRISIDIAGLRVGSYVVRVELAGQAPIYGQLMVQ